MEIESKNNLARLCILISKLKESSVFEVNENNLLEIITAYSNLMQLYNN